MNNFQDLLSNIDRAALVPAHPTFAVGYSDGMLHEIPFSPTEAARYVGGHVDPLRESHESSTVSASVFRDLTECHPIADSRWSGVFGTTWDPNLSQGEPFNGEVMDGRWTESYDPTYNSDLNQGLLFLRSNC